MDLGCGDGIAAKVVFDKKIDYGLDNNPLAVEWAKKSSAYKKVILADASEIPLEDNIVDLVFSNCSLEHMKDLDSVLKEVFRILAKDGLFVFTVPSHYFKNYSVFSFLNLKWLAKIYGRLRNKKYQHYHSYSLKEWSRVLEKFGFKVIDGYYYLDKATLEFWDFLLILYVPLYLLIKLNQKFSNWIYETLFRKRIYKKFLKAKTMGSKGAAVCVVAQKVKSL